MKSLIDKLKETKTLIKEEWITLIEKELRIWRNIYLSRREK